MSSSRFAPSWRELSSSAPLARVFSAAVSWVAVSLAAMLWLGLSACTPIQSLAIRPFYRPAELSVHEGEAFLDVPYVEEKPSDRGPSGPPDRHRLDFYRPRGSGWPTLVFVHGGSLTRGDKSLAIGRHEIYRNIGRFYARNGVGVALVNYRLQPSVTWEEQVDDVVAAVSWVTRRAPELGGDGRVVLSGHSAGAWLAVHAALDPERLKGRGLSVRDIAGVVSVSGSGFDMTDDRTWELYPQEELWAELMKSSDPSVDWHEAASVVPLIGSDAPRFLLVHSTNDLRAVARQNRLLYEALQGAGVASELYEVDRGGHRRTVLAMSRQESPVAQKILDFLGTIKD